VIRRMVELMALAAPLAVLSLPACSGTSTPGCPVLWSDGEPPPDGCGIVTQLGADAGQLVAVDAADGGIESPDAGDAGDAGDGGGS